MLHGFLPFSPVSLTELCSFLVWFERSLHSVQVGGQSHFESFHEKILWEILCNGTVLLSNKASIGMNRFTNPEH